MSLKINEFEFEDSLYDISYTENIRNKFEKEHPGNLIFDFYMIDYEEKVEVYKNLGIETYYCDWNDCNYIIFNEKNLTIIRNIIESYDIEICDIDCDYTKKEIPYFKRIFLFKQMEKDSLEYNIESIISRTLNDFGLTLKDYNLKSFICSNLSLRHYLESDQKINPIEFYNNLNIEVIKDEDNRDYEITFNIDNLNNFNKHISEAINNKFESYAINKKIKFSSVDIRINDYEKTKYIRAIKYIIKDIK